jgi:hypothetical protein
MIGNHVAVVLLKNRCKGTTKFLKTKLCYIFLQNKTALGSAAFFASKANIVLGLANWQSRARVVRKEPPSDSEIIFQ